MGLSNKDQIIQITAFDKNSSFNNYSVSTVNIKAQASTKTGITIKRGKLFLHGQKLPAVLKKSLLNKLFVYLDEIKNSSKKPPSIILVGHNTSRLELLKSSSLQKS